MSDDAKTKTAVWSDDKQWVALIEADRYWADFRLVEVMGTLSDGTPMFEGPNNNFKLTDPDKAEAAVRGHVKWDGCTEAHIEQLHMCNAAESVLELGKRWAWALNQCHAVMVAAAESEGLDPLNALEWEPVDVA